MAFVLLLAVCASAPAATHTVTNPTDRIVRGQLTLRQAIAASVPGDIIDFKLPVGTVIPLAAELVVNLAPLTITGPGADQLTIGRDEANNPSSRIFNIQGRSTVVMSGLTIADGNLNVTTGAENSGGGILNSGRLTLVNCTISGNQNSIAGGGGISNLGGLTLNGCTVVGNTASQAGEFNNSGGGIYNTGTLSLVNSTISGNVVEGGGGGVYNSGSTTTSSVTIAFNQSLPPIGRIGGGGVLNDTPTNSGATVTMLNTIVADNRTSGAGPDFLGQFISQGYNLIGDPTNTGITGNTIGNQLGVDPLLGRLQNNGGTTPTHALLAGSPAIDQGNSGGLTIDQRGFPRPEDSLQIPNAPRGDGADIGAFEAPPLPPIEIVSITRLANDHILLVCRGVPNAFHSIQASPDLMVAFATIATVQADGNGNFQYDDPGAVGLQQRFYRLSYP